MPEVQKRSQRNDGTRSTFVKRLANDDVYPSQKEGLHNLLAMLKDFTLVELIDLLNVSLAVPKESAALRSFNQHMREAIQAEIESILLCSVASHADLPQREIAASVLNDIRSLKEHFKPRLPDQAKVLYARVPGRPASAFLQEHWGAYIDAGVIYQHHLARLDPKLLKALRNEFAGRPDDLRKLLPPKSAETDRLVEQAGLTGPSRAVRGTVGGTLRKLALAPRPSS